MYIEEIKKINLYFNVGHIINVSIAKTLDHIKRNDIKNEIDDKIKEKINNELTNYTLNFTWNEIKTNNQYQNPTIPLLKTM